MQCAAQRIVDRDVLRLIKMWLTTPVEERDENETSVGGWEGSPLRNSAGWGGQPDACQLVHEPDVEGLAKYQTGEQFQARVVAYADEFVILSRGKAAEALDWTRQVVTRMGVTLNETKTGIKQARKESFHFLGYTFGPHRYKKDGHWYLGASPSKKAVARIREKVGNLPVPSNTGPGTKCGIG